MLNKEQEAAVFAPYNKTLVLAAAGSGKTRVIVHRIAYAIAQGYAPGRIVAITFTTVAAREMEARLAKMGIKIGFVGTLHAFALKVITAQGSELGYRGMPKVIDEETAIARRKEIVKKLKLPKSTSLEAIDAAIGERGSSNAHLAAIQYRKEMRNANEIDFTLILAEFETLLRTATPKLSLDALFVDEYQDSGARDARIYDLIPTAMDCRVGDADQSMYSFRGGRVENILELAKSRTVYRLQVNFRSATRIVEVANRLIEVGPGDRLPMMPSRIEAKGVVTLKEYPNIMTEAASVAAFIRHSGRPAKDFAVLSRFNARANLVRDALKAEGVLVNTITKQTVERRTMEILEKLVLFNPYPDLGTGLVAAGVSMEQIRAFNDAWAGDLESTVAALKMAEEVAVGDGVHVGTVHSLKGGERPIVFVVGMEDHTTPGKKKGDEYNEERRIAYVAYTRAMDELHVSWSRMAPDSAGMGQIEAIASRFTVPLDK